MVEPRKPKEIARIIKRAKTRSAAADLKEYDKLLTEDVDCDPSVELSLPERQEKSRRQRRLKALARRLFGDSR